MILITKENSISEIALFAYNIFCLFIALVFVSDLHIQAILILFHLFVFIFIVLNRKVRFNTYYRLIFPAFVVLPFFNIIHFQIPFLKQQDWDLVLIEIDRIFFGGMNPAIFLSDITSPILSTIMQIVYSSFYIIPLSLLFFFVAKKQKLSLLKMTRVFVIGFLLSYVGYFIIPALGPRFYLSDDFLIPLTGNSLFYSIHNSINDLEQINWDAFPSGHTEIGVLGAILASHFKLRWRYLYWLLAIGIILSTVYLRYHYVIDIIAGILLALFVWWLDKKIEKFDAENWRKNAADS